MRPEFPEFKPVGMSDRGLIEEYAAKSPAGICDLSCANLFIWQDFERPSFTFVGENLCLLLKPLDEPPFFLEPLGSGDIQSAVDICIGHAGRISRASGEFVSRLPADAFSINPVREHFDYLYRTRELADLKGRRFDGKRGHIKKMKRQYPDYKYVQLTKEMAHDALALFDGWSRCKKDEVSKKGVVSEFTYGCQRAAIVRAFEHYDELGLMGGALAIGSSFAGFVIGSRLKDDMACVHFCYSRPDIPGSFQTLLWGACRGTFSGFEFVNLEQDLGLAGLRKVKCSYYPLKMSEKYDVKRL
ncbi:MAG: phosphatidylglycerol lysyltransferase domain-containing protein [Pseudomonadota bacterium]